MAISASEIAQFNKFALFDFMVGPSFSEQLKDEDAEVDSWIWKNRGDVAWQSPLASHVPTRSKAQ
jgi:hypothetical protein